MFAFIGLMKANIDIIDKSVQKYFGIKIIQMTTFIVVTCNNIRNNQHIFAVYFAITATKKEAKRLSVNNTEYKE